ncbi:MAG: recombination mediator RecR [Bacteroidetes bacterium]|nr:recombination mediator RecR [Bacteroidota bacterium]
MEFSSKLLARAVDEIAQLPGIGKRSALRLALHLLKQPKDNTYHLAQALTQFRDQINFCQKCHNLSDQSLCEICANTNRDATVLCIVEDIRDVMAIENTRQFKGYYHILGGIISPMDGVGPNDLTLESLVEKIKQNTIKEVIFALSATVEADTTNFYMYKILAPFAVKITAIARGIPIGDELEYTDEVTLGRSILTRIPYEDALKE